jgi:hypothetical protein
MHAVWHWLLYLLTWWSADPANLEHERARAAGAVAVAYASLAKEPAPLPRRETEPGKENAPVLPPDNRPVAPVTILPPPAGPCVKCNDTGRVYRPDGGFVRCGCQPCKSGSCPPKR